MRRILAIFVIFSLLGALQIAPFTHSHAEADHRLIHTHFGLHIEASRSGITVSDADHHYATHYIDPFQAHPSWGAHVELAAIAGLLFALPSVIQSGTVRAFEPQSNSPPLLGYVSPRAPPFKASPRSA